MNPEWDTPPNGDFTRYVERLTAQMALPRPAVQQAPNVIDDAGSSSQMQPHQMAAAVVPSMVKVAAPAAAINGAIARALLVAAVIVAAVLHLVFNVSIFMLVMIFAVIGWIAFKLRGALSGRGVEALRTQIERTARQAGGRS